MSRVIETATVVDVAPKGPSAEEKQQAIVFSGFMLNMHETVIKLFDGVLSTHVSFKTAEQLLQNNEKRYFALFRNRCSVIAFGGVYARGAQRIVNVFII